MTVTADRFRASIKCLGFIATAASLSACAAGNDDDGVGSPFGGTGGTGMTFGGAGGGSGSGGTSFGGGSGSGGTSFGGSAGSSSGGSAGSSFGGSSGSSFGGSAGTGAGTGGGSGTGAGGTTGSVTVTDMIDDLEHEQGSILAVKGRVGAWYTYNDKTAGGMQTPAEGTTFIPAAGGHASAKAAHTNGMGFTVWGAGMGFDLNNSGTAKGTWDAAAYTGIAFWAKGTAFRVKILVPATVPGAEGGTCAPVGMMACGNNHGMVITPGADWQQFVVPFASLTQETGWGIPAQFDKTKVIGIQFQVGASATFDYWIDDIGFY